MNVKIDIAPGAVQPVNIKGRNFYVVFSPVDIEIKRPGSEWATYPHGTGLDTLGDGGEFERLEVRNPSVGTITVVLWIGGPLFRDSRAAIIEPRTEIDAWSSNQLAATTGQTFSGLPSGLRIRRKCIQVTNLDANLNLQIRDAAGHVGLTIFPSTSITLPISESVEVYNPNGSPVSCSISEIWWTL